jgi:hypothetical protein
MPAEFGSTVKHAFTARQFAEAFGARLVSASTLRLVVVPRLADTTEPAGTRHLSKAQALDEQLGCQAYRNRLCRAVGQPQHLSQGWYRSGTSQVNRACAAPTRWLTWGHGGGA